MKATPLDALVQVIIPAEFLHFPNGCYLVKGCKQQCVHAHTYDKVHELSGPLARRHKYDEDAIAYYTDTFDEVRFGN